MALYNFQGRFVPMILSGEKTHTIRAKRKRATQPGEILHLYTGLRQKGAKLLMRVPCTKVEEIWISTKCDVLIDGALLDLEEKTLLAQRDGFNDFAEMMIFWNGRRPFRGDIIHWKYPPYSSAPGEKVTCANVNGLAATTASRARIASARKPAGARTTTPIAAGCEMPSTPAKRVAGSVGTRGK